MPRPGAAVCALLALPLAAAAAAGQPAQPQPAPPFAERWKEVPPARAAQNAPKPAQPPASAAQNAPKPAPPPAGNAQSNLPVSLEQALYLIRSTLLTLNDANRSGNYTVLHDLAAPGFQAKNNSADLARIFTDLRNRHFDLFAVALAAPRLSTPPHLESNGMLRLTGEFPTRPLQINFDLLFENVGGQWKLFGISVATPQAPAAPEAAQDKGAATAHKDAPAPRTAPKKP